MTFKLLAPAAGAQFNVGSGASYTADSYGIITGVPAGNDLRDLLVSGCVFPPDGNAVKNNMIATTSPGATNDSTQDYGIGSLWFNKTLGLLFECADPTATAAVWAQSIGGFSTTTPGANGLYPSKVSLLDVKNADGTTLTASAAAGKFGLTYTPGTTQSLVTEAANNNTKTDSCVFDFKLPSTYKAGQNINVTVDQKITIGGGTLSAKSLTLTAYKNDNVGGQGANIGPAGQTLTNAGGDLVFAITGTSLNPGDLVSCELTTVLTETAASAVTANLNNIRIS